MGGATCPHCFPSPASCISGHQCRKGFCHCPPSAHAECTPGSSQSVRTTHSAFRARKAHDQPACCKPGVGGNPDGPTVGTFFLSALKVTLGLRRGSATQFPKLLLLLKLPALSKHCGPYSGGQRGQRERLRSSVCTMPGPCAPDPLCPFPGIDLHLLLLLNPSMGRTNKIIPTL